MGRWPRLTIGRMMIGVAVVALLLHFWRFHPGFFGILLIYGMLFLPIWVPGRPNKK